jgi:hypothetical protein
MEIKADLNFKVLIYEHDFGKLQMESIAFGQDTVASRLDSLLYFGVNTIKTF